jgi:glutaredoxin 3
VPKVEIYSTQYCPYCVRAKELFERKHVKYVEYRVDENQTLRDEMLLRSSGKRSVPQIFINDHHVGGCDDLHALEAAQKLDALLKG